MTLKLTPLKSSNIEGCHFDPVTGVLAVKFKSGGTYHYSGCRQEHYDGLCSAESAGRYLHQTIKGAFKAKRRADSK